MTTRAGIWSTVQVGRHVHAVAWAADQLGVNWHTVMDAIELWGGHLVEHPDRIAATTALGVDETSWLAATATESTRWVASICDVEARQVIDVIEGRGAGDLGGWLEQRPQYWKDAVTTTVSDLHEPFRAALETHFPDAVAVADPFHVVAVGTRAVDKCRRRVQQELLGHRGRKHDPLFRARKLLAMADERLDDNGRVKRRGLLAAGDPTGEVSEVWLVKECLRDLYTITEPNVADQWLDGLIDDCLDANSPEARSVATTLKRWRSRILAWHSTGVTNGPVEGLNSIIKKIKRVGAGFRSFTNYRLRILLAIGGCNWTLLNTEPR